MEMYIFDVYQTNFAFQFPHTTKFPLVHMHQIGRNFLLLFIFDPLCGRYCSVDVGLHANYM